MPSNQKCSFQNLLLRKLKDNVLQQNQGIKPGKKKAWGPKEGVEHSTQEKHQGNVLKAKGMLLKTSA